MDRLQKIELLKGILEGRRSVTEIAEKHLWIVEERTRGTFTNPDTGKSFPASEFDEQLRQARLRHKGKLLSVLLITTDGGGMDDQTTFERTDYSV